MTIQFEIDGLESLQNKLKEVSHDVKYKGGRFALRKAANLIRDAAKQNALRVNDPTTPEEIAKNVAVRWSGRHFKRTGQPAFRVGILGGAKQYANTKENVRKRRAGQSYATAGSKENPGGDTFYWRFVEFGTRHSRPRKFFERTLELNAPRAIDEFVKQYGKALDRAIKRAKKGK